jgi:hypothetical protein
MAFCPECSGAMGASELACPHCGYDFPLAKETRRVPFAYTRFGEVGLKLGIVATSISIFVIALSWVASIVGGKWTYCFVEGPLKLCMLFALLVMLQRVQTPVSGIQRPRRAALTSEPGPHSNEQNQAAPEIRNPQSAIRN